MKCLVEVNYASFDIATTNFHGYFDEKITDVRAAAAAAAVADAPRFTTIPVGCILRLFSPAASDEAVAFVPALPDK
jgi:hypothetical protein